MSVARSLRVPVPQHLKEAFVSSIQPAAAVLLQAYPGLLQPQWFTWETFLWASELSYAYAMQVSAPFIDTLENLISAVSAPVPRCFVYFILLGAGCCLGGLASTCRLVNEAVHVRGRSRTQTARQRRPSCRWHA